jgi:predicted Zn-dependent protease
MAFGHIDVPAIVRALTQVAERPDDHADLFLERREQVELCSRGRDDAGPGLSAWTEAGLALRLVRDDRSWLASTDQVSAPAFNEALRRVVRTMPRAPFPHLELRLEAPEEPPTADELARFVAEVEGQSAARGLTASVRVRRHRRQAQMITLDRVTGIESETYYSVVVDAGKARSGHLLTSLLPPAADDVVLATEAAWLASRAQSPAAGQYRCVLDADAVAVLLHEAVAHALEADLLARSGRPESAIGVAIGSPLLHVFDDPTSAPAPVRRAFDDEGSPAIRRYLVRGGLVEQPICDRSWARSSPDFVAGSGRRGDRHELPGPRSYHLTMMPGESPLAELLALAEGGLFLPSASRGRLDPLTGEFTLQLDHGRRIRDGAAAEIVGPCTLRARLGDLLSKVIAVGDTARPAGAGWCAKDGVLLPVWATAPALLLDAVEVWP